MQEPSILNNFTTSGAVAGGIVSGAGALIANHYIAAAAAAKATAALTAAAASPATLGVLLGTTHAAAATGLAIGGIAILPFLGIVAAGLIVGALISGYIGKQKMEAERQAEQAQERNQSMALSQARSRAPVVEQEYDNPAPRVPFTQQVQPQPDLTMGAPTR